VNNPLGFTNQTRSNNDNINVTKINNMRTNTNMMNENEEGGGTLKIKKQKDDKYYWTFTFKSGKVVKWPNGFASSADAQKDFMYRSDYLSN
jgi:hypothetical protein